MKQKYDLVVGFGNACSCSQILRAAGLQLLSFPFDWIIYTDDEPHDLIARTTLLENNFSGWLEKHDLSFKCRVDWHSKDVYENTRTHVIFNHDFPKLVPIDESFNDVRAKYSRRIARLYQCIEKAERILIVRIDRPDQIPATPIADCMDTIERLRKHFPAKSLHMLLLQFDKGRSILDRATEEHGDAITRIAFDYKDYTPGATSYAPDIPTVARLLADCYEVAEYRTKKEISDRRAHDREAKYQANGANNLLQYRWIKLKRKMDKIALCISPRILLSKIRARKFNHIITLGVNCEPAFRFYDTWGFVDSSLFSWAQCFSLEKLTGAISNLDRICSGAVELDPLSKMWICRNSGIYLHGQLKWGPGIPTPTPDALEKDRCDLIGRVAHLREKFLRYATDGESLLFVHRLCEGDEESNSLGENLLKLMCAIDRIGSKNYKLLVVCEQRFLDKMPTLPNCEFRSVTSFNPGHAITDVSLGDRVGWQAIFREFAPTRRLPKKHSFKFE